MRVLEGQVAAVAQLLRVQSGQSEPPFNAYTIVEAIWPSAVITGRDLEDGVDEVLAVTSEGPLIIYNRKLSTAESRISIGHAIAHLVLDGDHLVGGVVIDPEREERAERFARELLVPPSVLRSYIEVWPSSAGDPQIYLDQVDRIASIFHVPPPVIDEQIRELERLGDS